MTYTSSDARPVSDTRIKRDQPHGRQPRTARPNGTSWHSARGEPPATVNVTWGIDVHDTTIVDATGELCTLTAERAGQVFRTIAETSTAPVAIDMSEVTFIDCRGVSLFLRTQSRLAERGLRCRIVSPSPAVRRLFDLLGLDDRLSGRCNLGENQSLGDSGES